MQRFETGFTGIHSSHYKVVVALFGPQKLHLSIETVLNSVFRCSHKLAQEEVSIKISYFFMNIRSMKSSEHILNANIIPE